MKTISKKVKKMETTRTKAYEVDLNRSHYPHVVSDAIVAPILSSLPVHKGNEAEWTGGQCAYGFSL